jgi:hypothetical protein
VVIELGREACLTWSGGLSCAGSISFVGSGSRSSPGRRVPAGGSFTEANESSSIHLLFPCLSPPAARYFRPTPEKLPFAGDSSSGANRDRTGDLLLAKQALSQLSYGPARVESNAAPEAARAGQRRPVDVPGRR